MATSLCRRVIADRDSAWPTLLGRGVDGVTAALYQAPTAHTWATRLRARHRAGDQDEASRLAKASP